MREHPLSTLYSAPGGGKAGGGGTGAARSPARFSLPTHSRRPRPHATGKHTPKQKRRHRQAPAARRRRTSGGLILPKAPLAAPKRPPASGRPQRLLCPRGAPDATEPTTATGFVSTPRAAEARTPLAAPGSILAAAAAGGVFVRGVGANRCGLRDNVLRDRCPARDARAAAAGEQTPPTTAAPERRDRRGAAQGRGMWARNSLAHTFWVPRAIPL